MDPTMTSRPDGRLQPDSRLADLADRLDLDSRLEPVTDLRWKGGVQGAPTLCLDDFSAIPCLKVPGAEEYQHRARLRAREGDLFAAVSPPSPGYEEYCRSHLGLGNVELIRADADVGQKEVARSCLFEPAFGRLVDLARESGGLNLHPYMGIDSVWELARHLASESQVPVEVFAPPSPVTWVANDKGLLSEIVERLLGAEWLVETLSSRLPAELASFLIDLAGRHASVALKRLRCASAVGNKVFASRSLLGLSPQSVEEDVRAFLDYTEWDGEEEILAVAWERTPLSPSTQLLIPPQGQGEPRVEGVYEQILDGEEGLFVGSRPSTLPETVNRSLADAARTVGAGLQSLGYVGRCSFDHLILGDLSDHLEIRFTECNGRWGGTSTPMSLVDRLIEGQRPPYRAQDIVDERLIGVPFLEILDRLGDQMYDPSSGEGRFLLYNVGPLKRYGKFDVIAFGTTQEEAEAAMEVELPAALGL